MRYRVWWRKRFHRLPEPSPFPAVFFECDEILAPDALVEQTALSGAVTDIDESPLAADSLYLLLNN